MPPATRRLYSTTRRLSIAENHASILRVRDTSGGIWLSNQGRDREGADQRHPHLTMTLLGMHPTDAIPPFDSPSVAG